MGRMMRNFIESDKAKELFKQVPPGTVEALAETNTPIGKLLKGSGVAYPQQQTQTYAPLVQLQQPLPPLQFDNPERAERIESSLGRAAFGPERIREILMQLKEANFLANGGRVGYVGGGPATTQDYATALSKVGAGTQEQKNRQVQDYARSEASSQIANALQGGQSSLDSYLTNVFGQGTPATTSGKYASYNSPFTGIFSSTRNQMIDDVAQQLVQKQAPSFYVDPKASASEAYGKMMQQKIEEAYGTPDKYRAEAMTLGMPVEAYYDYLTTRDDKNIMQQYRKQDPYFDPSTYVPFTEADRTSSPYDIYLQQVLQQQIDAGIPEEGRIQPGEVALPSMISPTTTGAAPRPFMSYSDALAQTRQSLGLADGGLATLFSMKR
jgi:hypothetical protein